MADDTTATGGEQPRNALETTSIAQLTSAEPTTEERPAGATDPSRLCDDLDKRSVARPKHLQPPAEEPYAYAKFRFEVALAAREREIDLLWSRSLMFWGFVSAAFAGTALAISREHRTLGFALSCVGLATSFIWTLANRSGRFWFLNWERKVEEYEAAVIGKVFGSPVTEPRAEKLDAPPTKNKKPIPWWRAKRYSPSRLNIALSDFVVAVWSAMLAFQILYENGLQPGDRRPVYIVAVVATFAYLLFVWRKTRHWDESQGE